MTIDSYDESIFRILRSDVEKRHIKYAVQTTIQAVEYSVNAGNPSCPQKCPEQDRINLETLIKNLIRPFHCHRRLSMMIVALIYIDRAKSQLTQPDLYCTVFLSAMMLAAKYTGEKEICNRAWKHYAGISSHKQLNQAQGALLHALRNDLSITDAQMLHHLNALHTYGRPWATGGFPSVRFSGIVYPDGEDDG